MKKTLFILLLISTGAFAQSTSKRQCGTMQHLSVMTIQNPQLDTAMQQYSQKLDVQQFKPKSLLQCGDYDPHCISCHLQ